MLATLAIAGKTSAQEYGEPFKMCLFRQSVCLMMNRNELTTAALESRGRGKIVLFATDSSLFV